MQQVAVAAKAKVKAKKSGKKEGKAKKASKKAAKAGAADASAQEPDGGVASSKKKSQKGDKERGSKKSSKKQSAGKGKGKGKGGKAQGTQGPGQGNAAGGVDDDFMGVEGEQTQEWSDTTCGRFTRGMGRTLAQLHGTDETERKVSAGPTPPHPPLGCCSSTPARRAGAWVRTQSSRGQHMVGAWSVRAILACAWHGLPRAPIRALHARAHPPS